jgi:hypothetical protein
VRLWLRGAPSAAAATQAAVTMYPGCDFLPRAASFKGPAAGRGAGGGRRDLRCGGRQILSPAINRQSSNFLLAAAPRAGPAHGS